MPRRRSTTSPVDARLRRIRGDAPEDPSADAPRLRRRWLGLGALGVALLLVAVLVAVAYRASLPPRALARQWLANGVEVRLLAVSNGAQQSYSYRPGGLLRRAAGLIGVRLGDPAIEAEANVPEGALTIWMWVGLSGATVDAGAEVVDNDRRTYNNESVTEPLSAGAKKWGRHTLCWMTLQNYDRTATNLMFAVPLTVGQGAARFQVNGPAATVRSLPTVHYPLVSGDRAADLRLWQLRRVDPAVMSDWVSIERLPQPYGQYVVADVDARERASASQPGTWTLDVRSAVTDHGERLKAIKSAAGLVWLSNGREPVDYTAVALDLVARKWLRGRDNIVFRALPLPAKEGEQKAWSRQADEPFPAGKFVAASAERISPSVVRVTLTGQAPGGSQVFSLAWSDALDQDGQHLRPHSDTIADLREERRGEEQVTWQWTLDLSVRPGSKTMALALRVAFRAAVAQASALLTGTVQAPPAMGSRPGLGLVLEPFGADDRRPRQYRVGQVVPGTAAAKSKIAKGDEVLAIDGLPPEMLTRALMRRKPQDKVMVRYRHANEVLAAAVGLDAIEH